MLSSPASNATRPLACVALLASVDIPVVPVEPRRPEPSDRRTRVSGRMGGGTRKGGIEVAGKAGCVTSAETPCVGVGRVLR